MWNIRRLLRSFFAPSSKRKRRVRVLAPEQLETRALLASVMDTGTTLQIELELSERLQMVSNGSSYEFTSSASTFADGGVTEASDFAGFGTSSLMLNDLAQYTQIDIVDTAAGASVEFLDSGTNSYQHGITINLDNGANNRSVVFNGASHFGDHSLSVTTDGAMLMFTGTQITIHNGDLSLVANNQGDGTTENRGINIQGATITTTGSGNISLTGTGAANAPTVSNLDGIGIENNSRIESTSTAADAGTITLTGTSGGGADFETGVWIAHSTVSSVNGNIHIDGTGGAGNGTYHFGVRVDTATFASTGTGANAASITFDGTGGAATSWGIGVALLTNSSVTTVDGDIVVNANGGLGTGDNNSGLRVQDSVLQSSGTGAEAGQILINAVGGSGTNNGGGASLSAGSEILTVDGAISISASAGPDTTEHDNGGLFVSGTIRSTGTAPIDITGTAAAGTGFNRGVQIVGDTTVIESNSGHISITGTGGNSTEGHGHGVEIYGGATVQSQFGNIVVTGIAGSGASNNEGVALRSTAVVRSTGTGPDAARISIDGTGGGGDAWNVGVVVSEATVSSIDGEISMIAAGGDGAGDSNRGINFSGDYHVESTGTGVNAANISIVATGGSGTQFNHAFASFGGGTGTPEISTVDGDISIVGTSGTNLTGSHNSAVYIASRIVALDRGNIQITGTATEGTSVGRGVFLAGQAFVSSDEGDIGIRGVGALGTGTENEGVAVGHLARIQSALGNVQVYGTSGSNNSHGVEIWGNQDGGGRIDATVGTIELRADGAGTGAKADLKLYQNSLVGGATTSGRVSVYSDTVDLDAAGTIQTSGSILVAPFTLGAAQQSITLGGEDSASRTDLNLTAEEIATLNAPQLTFGNPDVVDNQNYVRIGDPEVVKAASVYGGVVTNTSSVPLSFSSTSIRGDVSPGPGIGTFNVRTTTLLSGSRLILEFDGETAGSGPGFHDQLHSSGVVDVNPDVFLEAISLPSWRPTGGEELVIVRRTGGSGTFLDLPEGATLHDFFDATISYQGGDGNDISLKIPDTNVPPRIVNLSELDADGITVFGADATDMAGGSVQRAGDVNGDGLDDFLIGATNAFGFENGTLAPGDAYLIFGGSDSATPIDLRVPGDWGVTFFGADVRAETGRSLTAGDFNNDGYSDILISAHKRPGNGDRPAGGAYLIWGGPALPQSIQLATLGSLGVTMTGQDTDEYFGTSVSAVGDINDDGIDDFAIGVQQIDDAAHPTVMAGGVYVVFGGSLLPQQLQLSPGQNTSLTVFGANSFDIAGSSLAAMGDVNGDGVDDLGIGAVGSRGLNNDNQAAGAAYVVFGDQTLSGTLNLATDADVTVYGADAFDQAGLIRGGGDVNGDGYNDALIGAPGADGAGEQRPSSGETYLLWGGPTLPPLIVLDQLGNAGITIYGADTDDESGRSVDIIGDINDDGYAEIAIGSALADGVMPTEFNKEFGEVVVIPGASRFRRSIDLAHQNTSFVTLAGADMGDRAGIAVSSAGDVNGDGIEDLLVGASRAASVNNARAAHAGEAYVIFGSSLFEPFAPITISPEGGARLTDTSATVLWRANTRAESYELWLELIGGDANPVVNTVTSETQVSLTDLGIGRYRSWVRANLTNGSKTPWTSSTFTVVATTTIHDLPDSSSGDLRPTISWDAVPGATGYRVYVSNVTQQQNALIDTIVTDTQLTPDFDLELGNNRIWVQPLGAENFRSRWSASKDYSVVPQLLQPQLSTLNQQPTFRWSAVPGVSTYQLYVQTGSQVVVNIKSLTSTSYTPSTNLAEGEYRWWVRGFAASGRPSRWSNRGDLDIGGRTTVTEPSAPVVHGLASITWNPVEVASSYEVYLYSLTDSRLVQRVSGIAGTTFESAPLAEGNYRVWVRTWDLTETPIKWSRPFDFSVTSEVPSLSVSAIGPVTPTFDSTPVFSWTSATQATSYNLYLTNGQTTVHQTDIVNTHWTPSAALETGSWNWWVQAVDATGRTGPWSPMATTDTSGRAVVLTPLQNSGSQTFRWHEVIGADRYVLQIDNIDTGQTVVREDHLTQLTHSPTTPLASANYRIWVRAISGTGTMAPWSYRVDAFLT